MELAISRALLNQIRLAAAESPDAEICGLLFGTAGVATGVLPCANVASNTSDSFEIDPRALIAAHRDARSGGPALIGHYHSHPHGRADPSPRDIAAAQPGSYWIIAGGHDIACWFAAPNGCFVPVAMLDPRD